MVIFKHTDGTNVQTYEGFTHVSEKSILPFLALVWWDGEIDLYHLETPEAVDELKRYYRMCHNSDVRVDLFMRS